MRTSRQYDALGRLTLIGHTRLINVGGEHPATIASYAYRYNTAGQRDRVTHAETSYWSYGYDTLGQLSSAVHRFADGTLTPGWQFGYDYDDIGQPSEARPPDPPGSGTERSEVSTARLSTEEGGDSAGGRRLTDRDQVIGSEQRECSA
jgi:YD repeat-containing protein